MTLDLTAIKERREAAFEWVFAMCKGKTRFKMSIPYEETDTDAILSAALKDSETLEAENARLKADLREYVEDGFLQGAHRQEDGGYSTGGISTYRDLGDWLVEHAGWTRREGGVGRMQVYDPPRRFAGGESER